MVFTSNQIYPMGVVASRQMEPINRSADDDGIESSLEAASKRLARCFGTEAQNC